MRIRRIRVSTGKRDLLTTLDAGTGRTDVGCPGSCGVLGPGASRRAFSRGCRPLLAVPFTPSQGICTPSPRHAASADLPHRMVASLSPFDYTTQGWASTVS